MRFQSTSSTPEVPTGDHRVRRRPPRRRERTQLATALDQSPPDGVRPDDPNPHPVPASGNVDLSRTSQEATAAGAPGQGRHRRCTCYSHQHRTTFACPGREVPELSRHREPTRAHREPGRTSRAGLPPPWSTAPADSERPPAAREESPPPRRPPSPVPRSRPRPPRNRCCTARPPPREPGSWRRAARDLDDSCP